MFSLQRLDLLFALVSVVCAATLWPDEVYINTILIDGQLGNDTPSCLEPWKGPLPCKSLSYALQGYRNDSTLYVLSHGRYTLNSSVMTFTNLNVIGISGNNSLVVCSDNAGLAFESVSYITITNVTFFSCGALRNSTSRNYSDSDVMTLSTFKVGLYFFLCGYVHLETMVVANSISATGVVMYDTTGYNEIISCEFYNNSVPDPSTSLLGGGGFYVEFTYCSPTGYCGNTVYNYNVGSTIIFYNCTFHNNVAMDAISLQSHSIPIIPSNGNHVAFGRGGGLSLFFNGNASHNTLSIINCNFSDNKALYGGGLFIEFHDTAVGNTVGVTGCLFLNNSAPFSGGGVRIGHFVLTNNGASYNNVTLHESDFSFNYGYYGGGLSIEPALQDTLNAYAVAYFLSQTCQFVGNVAMLGSAVYVSLFTLITTGLPPTIYFYHTLVQDNVLITSNPYNRYGAVHIHLVAVKFRDLIRFENNNGSALALVASHADFTSCRAEFFGNVGPNGAAIALLGAAWVIIGEDTIMRFVNNIATINGGAIYNMYIEKEKFSTSTNCFLKYRNATVSPENWTAHFTFINNSDSQGQNSIHSTSILPCGVLSSLTDPSKIFCWNNTYWNYSGSTCKEQISTDGSNVSMSSIPSFYPGQIAQLPLTVTDDLGNEVLNQTVFTGFINDTLTALSPQFTYIVSGYVQLTGNSDRNTTLFLNAAGNGDQLYSEFTIKVIECPPGLTPSPPGNKNATCVCDLNGNFGGLLLCLGAGQLQNNNTPPALLQQGNWIGIADSNSALLAGPCPPGYCDGANSNSLLDQIDCGYSKCTDLVQPDSLVTSNGVSSGYKRVYSAGQYSSTDNTFVTCYAIMAYVLLLMPILLLIVLFGYPVHFLERMVNKVPFLQKHYPADKMNIFLDTFQGDFKNNRRFYASFYFLFRLVVAVEYIVAVSGINQLSLQLGTCVIMIFISALLKPYKRPFLNYLDILMFANMAVLGSLSMYMLQNPSNKNLVPFILQYILIMTPAILYAGVYLAWIMGLSNVRNVLSSLHLGNSKRHTAVGAREKRSSPLSDEDVLIDRSRETNSYTYLYDSVSEKNTVDSGKTKEVYINS
ncbi:hypothetical protein EMCRGX_G013606 [Ephydatia muelleri]|eukprot:Em0004g1193a